MEDAHAVIGHHVQLGLLDGDVSSSGLVLLAFGPRDLQERVLAGPLVRYTAHTICSASLLRSVLAEVRRQGIGRTLSAARA